MSTVSLSMRAFAWLVAVDFIMKVRGFRALYQKVKQYKIARRHRDKFTVSELCKAVDRACTWYPKNALCLQRSAVATFLLRRNGVAAQLVLGARRMPFQGHAWVEVKGLVVNDVPRVQEIYSILDRL